MQIYIDQSGKVEYTSKPTVVAYSNSKNKAISISAVEKQKVQKVFRDADKPNMFMFKTLAIMIYLLIKKDIPKLQGIVIDREYKGREDLIKKYVIELIRRGGDEFDPKDIHFKEIGKKNNAHKKAITVYRGEQKPDKVITSKDIYEWLV